MDSPNPQRDERGRFAKGNSGGPGRPRGHRDALRKAAEEAVTPEHAAALMRRALRMALEGNLPAMRLVLERTCGKPAEAPSESLPVEIQLPKLDSTASCLQAIDSLTTAIVDGTTDRATAKLLLDAITAKVRAIEVHELEQRLAALEQTVSTVELDPPRRR